MVIPHADMQPTNRNRDKSRNCSDGQHGATTFWTFFWFLGHFSGVDLTYLRLEVRASGTVSLSDLEGFMVPSTNIRQASDII
jgi:hypothetical protein